MVIYITQKIKITLSDLGRSRSRSLPSSALACPHFAVQSMAAGCEKGFVKCFLKVPLASLGSMAVVVQPNGLWNSQKTFYKTCFTSCRLRLRWFQLLFNQSINFQLPRLYSNSAGNEKTDNNLDGCDQCAPIQTLFHTGP